MLEKMIEKSSVPPLSHFGIALLSFGVLRENTPSVRAVFLYATKVKK
jgi:hypothetical protein